MAAKRGRRTAAPSSHSRPTGRVARGYQGRMRELLLIGRGRMDFIPELAVASGELASRLVGELNRGRPVGTEPYTVASGLLLVDSLEEIEVYDHVVLQGRRWLEPVPSRPGEGVGLAGIGRRRSDRGGRTALGRPRPQESVERWAAERRLTLRDDNRRTPHDLGRQDVAQARSA